MNLNLVIKLLDQVRVLRYSNIKLILLFDLFDIVKYVTGREARQMRATALAAEATRPAARLRKHANLRDQCAMRAPVTTVRRALRRALKD